MLSGWYNVMLLFFNQNVGFHKREQEYVIVCGVFFDLNKETLICLMNVSLSLQ